MQLGAGYPLNVGSCPSAEMGRGDTSSLLPFKEWFSGPEKAFLSPNAVFTSCISKRRESSYNHLFSKISIPIIRHLSPPSAWLALKSRKLEGARACAVQCGADLEVGGGFLGLWEGG